jgi:hypothetical protein
MPFEKQLIRHENFKMRMFSRIHGIPSSMGKGEIDENILLKLLGKSTVRISRVLFTTNGIS